MKRLVSFILVLAASLFWGTISVRSEEGGRGHTWTGDKASLAGTLPSVTGTTFRFKMMFYDGNVEKEGAIPDGRGATGYTSLDRAFSATQFELAYVKAEPGEGWRYGFEMSIPLVYESASIYARRSAIYTVEGYYYDYEGGVGDISFTPLMIGKQIGSNHFKTGVRMYAPTGHYRSGNLAQGGLNYWTYSPFIGLTQVIPGQREISIHTGYDINERNEDTDYKSGNVWHLDAVLALYTDMQTAVGITGNIYKQVEADQGSGAVLGSFKAQTYSIGPMLRHTAGGMSFEFKWLPEFDVKNRTEGNTIWMNFGLPF